MEVKSLNLKLKSEDVSVITAFLSKLRSDYNVIATSSMMYDDETKEFHIFANVILVKNEGSE